MSTRSTEFTLVSMYRSLRLVNVFMSFCSIYSIRSGNAVKEMRCFSFYEIENPMAIRSIALVFSGT